MAYKVFSNGDALTGSELNTYLMNQSVMVFASTTARDAALTTPSEGMVVWLQDSDKYVYYTGSAWADLIAAAGSGNAIINGGFDIWQRGTSGTLSGADAYTVDRFKLSSGTGGVVAWSRQSFTPGQTDVPGNPIYFVRSNYTTSGTGGAIIETRIEDVNSFAGQTVAWTFYAKVSAGSKSLTPRIVQDFGSGGSATVVTNLSAVTLTTSWQRITISTTVPSVTGKTIGSSSYLRIDLLADTTGTLTYDWSNWQLEAGSTATAFKRNASNIQGELAACQRYYFRESLAGFAGSAVQGFALSSTSYTMWTRFPVTMRTAPTSLDYSTLRVLDSGNSAQTVTNLTLLSTDAVKTSSSDVTVTVSGATSGRSGYLQANAGAGFVGFSAEL